MGLLNNYDSRDIERFLKDISLALYLLKNIDQEYGEAKQEFIHDFTHFKALLKTWNEKYKNLQLVLVEDDMQIKLKIIIRDEPRSVLTQVYSIENLVLVNGKHVSINKSRQNESFTKITLVYGPDPEQGDSLTLESTGVGVELIYQTEDMTALNSAEFQLCAHYALKNCSHGIEIQEHAKHFSFDTDIWEAEGQGISYQDRVKIFGMNFKI